MGTVERDPLDRVERVGDTGMLGGENRRAWLLVRDAAEPEHELAVGGVAVIDLVHAGPAVEGVAAEPTVQEVIAFAAIELVVPVSRVQAIVTFAAAKIVADVGTVRCLIQVRIVP